MNLDVVTPANTVTHPRSRLRYCMLTILVIALGLASRSFPAIIPSVVAKYLGDALWTIMVFCAVAVLAPRLSTARLALCALAISFAVEFAQLYRAPWIMEVRSTTLGRLALGNTFAWPDLAAYAAGALAALLIEQYFRRQRH